VFLSCSEKFRESVEDPFKEALRAHGIHGVIVSEEPRQRGPAWDPEAKVDSLLRSCEAFVALVTPDDELADGTFRCRPNVSDEIGRARSDPSLSEQMMVLKSPEVTLWSNINPTYNHLDLGDPSAAVQVMLDQLRAWEIIGSDSEIGVTAMPSSTSPDSHGVKIPQLAKGLGPGDQAEGERRIYGVLLGMGHTAQQSFVSDLGEAILAAAVDDDNTEVLVLCSLLEAADRISPRTVPVELVEELAASPNFSIRSCASFLLWQWAETDPARIPIALLGRLAEPSREDWYVQAPAMAAAQQLLLRRPEARLIFEGLLVRHDAEDRYAAAVSLLEVARVEPRAVPIEVTNALQKDTDSKVRRKARELRAAVARVSEEERRSYYSSFGL
jgi:hypothetical protein